MIDKNVMKGAARPFSTIEEHDKKLIQSCIDKTEREDTIIHIGDLWTLGSDRGYDGLAKRNPNKILEKIPATLINIRGNHDNNNRVKSLCDSMRTHIGKRFPNVSISHYPTYDKRAIDHFLNADIHLCGHVHSLWKHCLDLSTNCLNINMSVDRWGFEIVSEEELLKYLNFLFTKKPIELFRCQLGLDGKVHFFGRPDF